MIQETPGVELETSLKTLNQKISIALLLAASIGCAPIAACRSSSSTPVNKPKLPAADAPINEFLLGKWSRADSEGGQYFLFAGDGFTATFDDVKKADPVEFPPPMRTGADRFTGTWSATDTELVLTHVSGPQVEKPIDEVRLPLKRLEKGAGIQIDGKTYRRGEFGDASMSRGNDNDDQDAGASDEDAPKPDEE